MIQYNTQDVSVTIRASYLHMSDLRGSPPILKKYSYLGAGNVKAKKASKPGCRPGEMTYSKKREAAKPACLQNPHACVGTV